MAPGWEPSVSVYDDIGANFDPGIGFIARPDQRNLRANVHYKPRPTRPGGWKGVRQLTFGHLYNRIENHDGVLETQTFRPGFLTLFQTEDQLMILVFDTFERVPIQFQIAPPGGDPRWGIQESARSRSFSNPINPALSPLERL
jgi:hypothetical protein